MQVSLGKPLQLALQLGDRDETKFVRARIYSPSGLSLSLQALNHVADGFYNSNAALMPNYDYVTVIYEVFEDAGFTTVSEHPPYAETFVLQKDPATIEQNDEIEVQLVQVEDKLVMMFSDDVMNVSIEDIATPDDFAVAFIDSKMNIEFKDPDLIELIMHNCEG